MKKFAAATLNMILALGVVCILAGVLLFPRLANHFNATVELWTIALTFAGAIIFYLSLVKFNSALIRFIGLYSVFSGFFFMIVGSGLVKQGIEGFWPVSIILAGISISELNHLFEFPFRIDVHQRERHFAGSKCLFCQSHHH